MENIIERIKKLLSLASNNPSIEEAQSAALKAQQLMVENSITLAEIKEDEEDIKIELVPVSFVRTWRSSLSSIIGPAFRCIAAIHPSGAVFIGHPTDRRIAADIFQYLYKHGHKHANKVVKVYKQEHPKRKTNGVYQCFIEGYLSGLYTKFKEQSKSLMVVVPKDVNEFVDSLNLRNAKKVTTPKMSAYAQQNGDAYSIYNKGYKLGLSSAMQNIEEGR